MADQHHCDGTEKTEEGRLGFVGCYVHEVQVAPHCVSGGKITDKSLVSMNGHCYSHQSEGYGPTRDGIVRGDWTRPKGLIAFGLYIFI